MIRPIIAGITLALLITTLVISKTNLTYLEFFKVRAKVQSAKSLTVLYPIAKESQTDPPEISARSATVIDLKTGTTLFEKNPKLKHLPASTTKLMTALISLEKCTQETVITVGDFPKIGNLMGLEVGDQITVINLIYGLLIKSGNDAAYVLANSCSSSYQDFITQMNEKAKSLEMLETHFVNPAGFDNEFQFSTAQDLTKLAKVAITNPLISKIVATKSTVVTDVSGNKAYYLENVNELLGEIPGLEGVKTGQTNGSLEILITKTTRDGNSIIIALLGSKDRFEESKQLIEWTFGNYRWVGT